MDRRYLLVLGLGLLLRWAVSLHPHSGRHQPPMYGDYEAQRHWMEVTHNLPLSDWYHNTTDNDLLYWGLDYPPLTAYHSYVCGAVAAWLDPSYVALHASRGLETPEHRLFMRSTVLVADLLVFLPAVLWFALSLCRSRSVTLNVLAVFALYPGLMLIDHGHFQYNGVSLGLTVAAVAALVGRRDLVGAALFSLALNYKQMELYHAMPFFCYLLGLCLRQRTWAAAVGKLTRIGAVVVATFGLVWLPFLVDGERTAQVVIRLFPFNRGLFEDKVANFWSSLSVAYKVKELYDIGTVASMCLSATAVCLMPSSLALLTDPTAHNLMLSLLNSALAFFLFSFQVHEKSILLAAIPACMLFPDYPLSCFWFLTASTLSMLPLLLKDGLLLATIATTVFFIVAVNMTTGVLDVSRRAAAPKQRSRLTSTSGQPTVDPCSRWAVPAFGLSLAGYVLLGAAAAVLSPPARYPDLWAVLISLYSFVHFAGFFLYFHLIQFQFFDEKFKIC
ncbi:dolichyl pyrophosphate Man9GlcNAc2 alpha-1,3-glucosyltransferase-like [Pollicipes pollicipes]|uniref:dolichyl pyrophosphate Man9GlcNAc2 alpha-1,3-glucosyltransferase-like n=1 Tax=Pollicipes pollicipes TaxID=41117 RepID=UPI001885517C|nr:dolichyl pyrophosphate Man9GlcNAc2 alpha-1,3-glucosyltransferase-like [Pollicipes pollicipes]XP_037070504.1 dolichyl pyrophosphate Man9GlcNAc2 alpha-1,3-glucosyltransferase-like [Pollicipes pollicipes]XP_037071520.1 dolichyl pyrophosphate Man9GlcNAc2 alpha-1,3-glucosyltransferase-like [Pollicipes pollicipes]XP_037071521.1 dolichyl pyrophosphate Man9GlcNAc2 alpha-1,3-glucosyltransferase-like [Pollicipes pollicipes]XP_037071522.1 dolichyl pyrophosphate Man9GlcNAc2 alpha-1,3-glucosyltransferase